MKGPTKTRPTPLSRPSWDHERRWLGAGRARVAGCDEAGRGPLAGPVVAAAVILRCDETIDDLNDSKKLDPEARLELYRQVRRRAVAVSVGMASHAEIDTINILQASLLAMRRAICGLLEPPEQVLVDGNGTVPGLPCPQEAIVDGDALCFSIAAASIVAKVVRDAIMVRLDGIHPGYGFASHKGYSCPEHYQALDRLGPCRIHRTSFAPVRRLLPDPPPLPPAKTRGASAEQLVMFSDELFGSGPTPAAG